MSQMVEETNLGCHIIESVIAKYRVLTRKTVTQWLECVRQEGAVCTKAMEEFAPNPALILVERVTQTADNLMSCSFSFPPSTPYSGHESLPLFLCCRRAALFVTTAASAAPTGDHERDLRRLSPRERARVEQA